MGAKLPPNVWREPTAERARALREGAAALGQGVWWANYEDQRRYSPGLLTSIYVILCQIANDMEAAPPVSHAAGVD